MKRDSGNQQVALHGLTEQQAAERLHQEGYNELSVSRQRTCSRTTADILMHEAEGTYGDACGGE